MASVARQYHTQTVHYLRKTITYADNGTTVEIGKIPSGSLVLKPASGVHVTTAFNGGTTNTLDIGYSTDSGTNNLATVLALGSANFVPLDEAVGDFLVTSDTIISGAVVSTAGASAGSAEVVICYIPDNDG